MDITTDHFVNLLNGMPEDDMAQAYYLAERVQSLPPDALSDLFQMIESWLGHGPYERLALAKLDDRLQAGQFKRGPLQPADAGQRNFAREATDRQADAAALSFLAAAAVELEPAK